MSTRSCPKCGTQYVATVRRCIDCDTNLVDDVRPIAESDEPVADKSTAQPQGRGDQVGYELAGWGNQLKVTLEGMLDRADIPRVWEAGALVVPAAHEAAVDELIATLEGGDIVALDDDTPRVALEIEGIDADEQADLDARLLASGVAHAWDEEGALIVAEEVEDQVLAIIDEVLEGDDDYYGIDPLAAQAMLSELYVAVDRLAKKPADPALGSKVMALAEDVADLPVPYGYSAVAWQELLEEIDALSDMVDPDGEGDEEAEDDDRAEPLTGEEAVAAAAQQLRDQLVELV